jgi:cyclopropane fatty-acyl-phospholipid synthase-like methyltransferase
MSAAALPHRIQRATQLLAPGPRDRLLEIGCGTGAATAHLAANTAFASLLAIDRSPSALSAARARCKGLAPGRLDFRLTQLAALKAGAHSFDKVFAINVNLFWLEASREFAVIRACLAREGRLLLFYEPPIAAKIRRIVTGIGAQCAAAGFEVEDVLQEGGQKAPFVAVAAKVARS